MCFIKEKVLFTKEGLNLLDNFTTKCVSTIRDECNEVGREISTRSKR